NILVPGKLAEREHTSRICRLVIFNDKLNWSAEHATRFVHFFSSELCTLSFVATVFSSGSSECGYHADFERLRATRQTGEHDHKAGQNGPLTNQYVTQPDRFYFLSQAGHLRPDLGASDDIVSVLGETDSSALTKARACSDEQYSFFAHRLNSHKDRRAGIA